MDGTIITKRGMQLLVKLMATKGTLTFTRVAIGTGSIPNGYDPASMIELVQYKMDGVISKCSAEEDVARITMQVSSVGIETGFIMTEMGVFASDPDIGEILYAYLDMKEDPQYIYAEGGETQKFVETTLEVAIEHATKVSTYINPSSLITKEDFDAEIEKIIIPEFDDSGEVTGITNFPAFLEKIKSKMNIFEFFKNLKAGLQFVLHTGQIVNNCVSDNPELPLSAAQGKILMDLINQTNGNLGSRLLNTSVLQKALDIPTNGFFVYNLDGTNYNGNDLPSALYSYGSVCIYKRNSESIFVFLTGIANSNTPLATNWYDGTSWKGWKTYITSSDLWARFNPIRIEEINGDTFSKALKNKYSNSVVFIAFAGNISDNPFSFTSGYVIAFNSGVLARANRFTAIGIPLNASKAIEFKIIDLT